MVKVEPEAEDQEEDSSLPRGASTSFNSCVKSEQGTEDQSDSSLPRGWQEVNRKLVSPEGRSFASRASAVEWMIKNRREPEEIYAIWSHLEKEGWELGAASTSLLPAGWRIKWLSGIQDWHFLSRWSRYLIPDNYFLEVK